MGHTAGHPIYGGFQVNDIWCINERWGVDEKVGEDEINKLILNFVEEFVLHLPQIGKQAA
jgi:hypothetical protein